MIMTHPQFIHPISCTHSISPVFLFMFQFLIRISLQIQFHSQFLDRSLCLRMSCLRFFQSFSDRLNQSIHTLSVYRIISFLPYISSHIVLVQLSTIMCKMGDDNDRKTKREIPMNECSPVFPFPFFRWLYPFHLFFFLHSSSLLLFYSLHLPIVYISRPFDFYPSSSLSIQLESSPIASESQEIAPHPNPRWF